MKKPSVGQTWEMKGSDDLPRRAKVIEVLADGKRVRLHFLDDGYISTVEAAGLTSMPGSKWHLVADADQIRNNKLTVRTDMPKGPRREKRPAEVIDDLARNP